MRDKIHVAIIRWNLADDYNRHTAAAMASVMENCSVPVAFHLLHEEKVSFQDRKAAEKNIEKYQELVSHYSSEVHFHNVILPEWIHGDTIPALKIYGTPTGFYRLFMSDLFPDLDRVISIGSDVIVKTDLSKLDSINIDNFSLAGCLDQGINQALMDVVNLKHYYVSVGMPMDSYVNADVLIFNLKRMRNKKILPDMAIDYLKKHPETPYLEQDIFNYILHGEIHVLPKRYNIFAGFGFGKQWVDQILSEETCSKETPDYILHFAKQVKPWDEYISEYDMEYWYYLSLTPWGNNGQVFSFMPHALVSSDDVIQNLYKYIWRFPLREKVVKIVSLTLPLWYKIGKCYLIDLGLLK